LQERVRNQHVGLELGLAESIEYDPQECFSAAFLENIGPTGLLTKELFSEKIQPLLSSVPMSVIRSSIGVSNWYASKNSKRLSPAPETLESALALLAGVSEDGYSKGTSF
jgi:hypothetical protein